MHAGVEGRRDVSAHRRATQGRGDVSVPVGAEGPGDRRDELRRRDGVPGGVPELGQEYGGGPAQARRRHLPAHRL